MNRRLLLAVAALGVAAAASGLCVDQRFREWDRRVEEVQEFARAETARADSVARLAAESRALADSLAREALSRAPIIRERIRTIRETVVVPDTCEVFVAERDSLINELLVENEQWRGAYEAERTTAERLREAYARSLTTIDSLSAVLDDRPRPRPSFLPSLEVGPFVGLCSNGPCVGVGVGLTWKVRLPL